MNIYRKQYGSLDIVASDMPKTIQTPTQTFHYPLKVTQNDLTIMEIIQAFPGITQKEIAEQLQWKVDRVKYYTKKLSNIDVLKRVGTNRKGYWMFNQKDKER